MGTRLEWYGCHLTLAGELLRTRAEQAADGRPAPSRGRGAVIAGYDPAGPIMAEAAMTKPVGLTRSALRGKANHGQQVIETELPNPEPAPVGGT